MQIAAVDMASFMVHADATVLEWHEAAIAETQNILLTDDGSGYVRISGKVHNPNAYTIKNVMVTGVLLDTAAQWVSYGVTTVLGKIEPDAELNSDVWVEKVPYVDYKLFVLAEGDFN